MYTRNKYKSYHKKCDATMLNALLVALFATMIISTIVMMNVPTTKPVVQSIPVVISEPVVLPVNLLASANFNDLMLWQVLYRLNWNYPKQTAELIATKVSGITYRTKIKELTESQKEQVSAIILQR